MGAALAATEAVVLVLTGFAAVFFAGVSDFDLDVGVILISLYFFLDLTVFLVSVFSFFEAAGFVF